MTADLAVGSASMVEKMLILAELTMGMWDLNLLGDYSAYLLRVSSF
jgi:hypothetical protein